MSIYEHPVWISMFYEQDIIHIFLLVCLFEKVQITEQYDSLTMEKYTPILGQRKNHGSFP